MPQSLHPTPQSGLLSGLGPRPRRDASALAPAGMWAYSAETRTYWFPRGGGVGGGEAEYFLARPRWWKKGSAARASWAFGAALARRPQEGTADTRRAPRRWLGLGGGGGRGGGGGGAPTA